MKIGIISDTHGYIDNKILKHLKQCDEVWHAGDIGSLEVSDSIKEISKLRAVYGNIDNAIIRAEFNEFEYFKVEDTTILITHIGGKPGYYYPKVRSAIEKFNPQIFVCGHSHILKIMFDKKYNHLYLNPGACGNSGQHKVKTIITFEILGKNFSNMEIIEIPKT